MARNPNTNCCACGKPFYRRPFEFEKAEYFCCKSCRPEILKKKYANDDCNMLKALKIGWELSKINKTNNHEIGSIKRTQESKDKISKINKEYWANHKEQSIALGLKHSKNCNHKTELQRLIRSHNKYKEWTRIVFEKDNYTCVKCGRRSMKGNFIYLQDHHKKPFSLILFENNLTENSFDSLQKALSLEELWDVNNGDTLCLDCHKLEHRRNNIYVRRRKK